MIAYYLLFCFVLVAICQADTLNRQPIARTNEPDDWPYQTQYIPGGQPRAITNYLPNSNYPVNGNYPGNIDYPIVDPEERFGASGYLGGHVGGHIGAHLGGQLHGQMGARAAGAVAGYGGGYYG